MTSKVAVIGGGIVGASAAFYLSKDPGIDLTLFDHGQGQGTRAAAGIISPWLSRRRNKKWYRMVKEAAAFYPDFMQEVSQGKRIPQSVYKQVGTLLFKSKPEYLEEMLDIGLKRREKAPEIGELKILSPQDIRDLVPIYDKKAGALWASGGAKVDGSHLVDLLLDKIKDQGGQIIQEKVQIESQTAPYQLLSPNFSGHFDKLVLANAAWLKESLEPLGYQVDVRAQKGQLAELQLDQATSTWPVIMPEGESDIIPFDNGQVIVGASHEDDMGFNLDLDRGLVLRMVDAAQGVFSNRLSRDRVVNYRVGTRAYTPDYAPFFGPVPGLDGVVAASGLGSTGLTAGPLVGKILYQLTSNQEPSLPIEDYPPSRYIPVLD